MIFLDPFGNQVGWETLRLIAGTQKVDLWYLFPAGLGVVRQIKNKGSVVESAEASLDSLFGHQHWRDKCIAYETAPDMFGENSETARKIATAEGITRYMIAQMNGIFQGRVAESWLPLGSQGVHKFSLIFACSNPSEQAKNLAHRVASGIMTRR